MWPAIRHFAWVALLVACGSAWAVERTVEVKMHGVLRSKGEYLSTLDTEKISGTMDRGHPATVTAIRDASQDKLAYCVAVDGSQKPELDEQIRHTAAALVREIARSTDVGRAVVFGKSMKQSAAKDWTSDANALAEFVPTHVDAKGADPYAALVDCADHLRNVPEQGPTIRAIFLVAGRPTESSPWSTEWFLQQFAKEDIQLYVVSFDPGLLTGGEEKKPEQRDPYERRTWPPRPEHSGPQFGVWYAPSLQRVAKDSAGDVLYGSAKGAVRVNSFTPRLRHQVELTVTASEKDAKTFRTFKLSAPDVEIQVPSYLFVPKR